MNSVLISDAATAPPVSTLRRGRVLARLAVSPAVADVVAGLAFGAGRRDDDVLLVAVTANRCAAPGGRL